jgi:hypothetical protein
MDRVAKMQTFFMNKTYETSADTLVALGWAALLQEAFHQVKNSGAILLRNSGASFEVVLSHPFQREDLERERPLPFLQPLISAKQDEKQTKKGRMLQDGFDYDGEQLKRKQQIGQLQQLPPASRSPEARLKKDPDLQALLNNDGPSSQLPHYQAINAMKIAESFNELVWRWQSLSSAQQWQHIALLCMLFSSPENDIDGAIHAWEKMAKEQHIKGKATVTALQILNPTTGKGANASKGNRLNAGGLESFWLLELLKFKGFMIGAAPYSLKGSKDRKTYVILPATVELQTLSRMMDQFRAICWSSTAVKQDILASLRLTQVLVQHRYEEFTSHRGLEVWEEPPIVSIAQGFDITSYKDMGSAYATMNVATINIPTWFPELTTQEQVEEADLLLTEHVRLIRRIEGSQGKEGSEEVDLLRAYRDFLSGRDLRSFWKFTTLYSSYLLSQREREKNSKRWLPQLTKKGLDTLVMSHQNTHHNLREILYTPGFQNIASAIRAATVLAQYCKNQRESPDEVRYEIRYGLGQELMRKARYRHEFMTALSKFLFLYNAETAREEEKVATRLDHHPSTKEERRRFKLRFPVSTQDIQQISDLLDTYPIELIASMLVAYGHARQDALKREEVAADLELVQNEA